MSDALPILAELSDPVPAQVVLTRELEVTATIVCPIDGEEIPACTCPLKE